MAEGTRYQSPLAAWIDRQPRIVLTVYAMTAAFLAYACMYAFRKPFTATGYDGMTAFTLAGVVFTYKPIAVIAQLLGYLLSKFIGIKVASEAPFARRVPMVLGLILFAELMLLFFGLVPAPWNLVFLFLNGLPLGMVWSLLFGLLEGRRVTEFLGLGMSISVIFSSGWAKGLGRWTMENWGVGQFWMPFVAGLLALPLLVLSLFLLRHLPPPDQRDREERLKRQPMSRADRRSFVRKYLFGVVVLLIGYLCLMTYRDLRDSFMDVILADLGHEVDSSTFFRIESMVGLIVIAVLSLLWFFKENRAAVRANMTIVSLGAVLLGLATVLLKAGALSPEGFYLMNGIGLYIAFVPYQSILMDRLVASLGTFATASFLIALADSYGYLSTVSLYLARDIFAKLLDTEIPWIDLLNLASYLVMVVVPLCVLLLFVYLAKLPGESESA